MRTFHSGGVAEGRDITQGLPRVEELFEARTPKTQAVLAELNGTVKITKKGNKTTIDLTADDLGLDSYALHGQFESLVQKGDKVKAKELIARSKNSKETLKSINAGVIKEVDDDMIVIKQAEKLVKSYTFSARESLKVRNGEHVKAGQSLTEGHLNLADLITATDILTTQKYIMGEVQSIYASQGQSINDKHIEIIVRQMFSKARIIEPGHTEYIPGQIINSLKLDNLNVELGAKKDAKPIRFERLLLGLTRISLNTESWLAAASFQETIRVLVEAAVTKKQDKLEGLKENVIIGKLIRAGAIFRQTAETANPEA